MRRLGRSIMTCLRQLEDVTEDQPDVSAEQQMVPAALPLAVIALQLIVKWEKAVVGLCFTGAITILTLQQQTQSKLPLIVELLSLVLLLCVLGLTLGKLVETKFPRFSKIVRYTGGILAVTGFFLVTVIPVSLVFQVVASVIYLLFCLFVSIVISLG